MHVHNNTRQILNQLLLLKGLKNVIHDLVHTEIILSKVGVIYVCRSTQEALSME